MTKKVAIYTLSVLLFLGVVGLGVYEYITLSNQVSSQKTEIDAKDINIQKLTDSLGNCQTTKYTSEKGHFSVVIPTTIYTEEYEDPENEDGFTIGGTYFSFDKNNPENGLLIIYSKPSIEGKGGSCLDDQGEGAFKTETIAGQTVEVCEEGGFSASYFKNPTRDIEYDVQVTWTGDNEPTEAQIEIFKNIIRTSLEFN